MSAGPAAVVSSVTVALQLVSTAEEPKEQNLEDMAHNFQLDPRIAGHVPLVGTKFSVTTNWWPKTST